MKLTIWFWITLIVVLSVIAVGYITLKNVEGDCSEGCEGVYYTEHAFSGVTVQQLNIIWVLVIGAILLFVLVWWFGKEKAKNETLD